MSEITVVRVPSVWSAKIPGGLWLNLAHARKLKIGTYQGLPTARIFWQDGSNDTFSGEKADALIDAWERAHNVQRDVEPASDET